MKPATAKDEAIEWVEGELRMANRLLLQAKQGTTGFEEYHKQSRRFTYILAALEKSDSPALKDAHNETRTRIIDILDECDRTVYAQQKWKVAHAGLQGWLFKIEAENPELRDSAATESNTP